MVIELMCIVVFVCDVNIQWHNLDCITPKTQRKERAHKSCVVIPDVIVMWNLQCFCLSKFHRKNSTPVLALCEFKDRYVCRFIQKLFLSRIRILCRMEFKNRIKWSIRTRHSEAKKLVVELVNRELFFERVARIRIFSSNFQTDVSTWNINVTKMLMKCGGHAKENYSKATFIRVIFRTLVAF